MSTVSSVAWSSSVDTKSWSLSATFDVLTDDALFGFLQRI